MAASVSLFKRLIVFVIVIAVVGIGSYFLFPDFFDQYLPAGLRPSSQVGESARDAGKQVAESLEGLEKALSDAGVSREEIQRIMDQVDAETLERAVRDTLEKGAGSAEQLFDSLKERVDFGSVDTEEVKRFFSERTRNIDFNKAFQDLGKAIEQGLNSLSDLIRGAVSK